MLKALCLSFLLIFHNFHCCGGWSYCFHVGSSSTTSTFRRMMSNLPHHIVVGMPALSPTMEAGTLSEWKIKEGSPFQAGDSLAEIQTDKASMDFEAQDDGFIAKYLVQAGTEVKVGDAIMVTVEDEEYVKAFANFSAPSTTKPEAPTSKEQPKAAMVPPPPPPAPISPPRPSAPTAAPVPTPTTAVAPTTPTPAAEPKEAASLFAPTATPMWGKLAKKSSPIAKTLSASQKKYIDVYGSTGQMPL